MMVDWFAERVRSWLVGLGPMSGRTPEPRDGGLLLQLDEPPNERIADVSPGTREAMLDTVVPFERAS